MKIAVISQVRNDDYFLKLWVSHYGNLLGRSNLHLILDGDDWECPVDLEGINVRVNKIRHTTLLAMDRRKKNRMQDWVEELFKIYDYVIRVDIDEYVFPDPASEKSIYELVNQADEFGAVYASSVDVVHDKGREPPVPLQGYPLLERSKGIISKLYTKPVIFSKPLPVRRGGHKVIGSEDVKVSSDIILLHLANVDVDLMDQKFANRRASLDHDQRYKTYENFLYEFSRLATNAIALDFDTGMAKARDTLNKKTTHDAFAETEYSVELRGELIKCIVVSLREDLKKVLFL